MTRQEEIDIYNEVDNFVEENEGEVTHTEIAQHFFELGRNNAHPHWISVEDEQPKEKGWIIVSTFFNSIACPAYYYEGEGVEEFRSQGITHWMRLPQAPKGGEE